MQREGSHVKMEAKTGMMQLKKLSNTKDCRQPLEASKGEDFSLGAFKGSRP